MSIVNLSIFKKEIDWKFVNYVHYILTEYMDNGTIITFNVEIDMYTVYQIDNVREGNFEIANQKDMKYISYEYRENGFNYIVYIKKVNDEGKDIKSTIIVNKIIDKIKAKYKIRKIDRDMRYFIGVRFALD